MGNLCEELSERLLKDQEENGRVAKTLHISITLENVGSISRSTSLFSYNKESLAKQALHLIANSNELPNSDPNWRPKIRNITLSSSKFIEMSQNNPSIQSYFKTVESCKLTEKIEPEQSKITKDEEQNINQSIIETPKDTDTGSTSTDKDKVNTIELVKCKKCDKKVSHFDLPEHLDYHIAKELQNSFRKEFAPRPLASQNSQKPISFHQSIIENPKETDTGSTSTDTDKVNSIEMVKCEKCDKEVSPIDLPEHLDYHVAKELQNEFRKEFAPRPLASHNSQKPINSTNGKRKSNADATQLDSKKQKTISNFFLKK